VAGRVATMTSLEQLCRTEEQKKIANILKEHGITTDAGLLLVGDAELKRCNIPPFVGTFEDYP